MSQERLPKESISQEEGQHAVQTFQVCHPGNWRVKDLSGDDEVGLDFQVQVVDKKHYKALFHVQLKGCNQKKKGSLCKRLNCNQTFYSQELKVTTLNYYLRLQWPDPLKLYHCELESIR
ncbi:MAG: DUF4365 domain-containing protein [Planctomycetes bacterium]|nr:DUF4365 domain-containing protein [Planctomycetota bacterium]